MRASEVFVVLPWFYVVVALRAALPLTLGSVATMFTVFALLATLGCATPARLFRGLVLSLKTGEFVIAARAAGAGRGPASTGSDNQGSILVAVRITKACAHGWSSVIVR